MKKVIHDSFKSIIANHLAEFAREKGNTNKPIIDHYAEHCVAEFERYLKAYNDFKED